MAFIGDRLILRNTDKETPAAEINQKPSSGVAEADALYVRNWSPSGSSRGLAVISENSAQPAVHVQGAGALLRLVDATGATKAEVANDGTTTVSGGLSVAGSVAFNGATVAAQPTVTGSRGGNAALASLLTALASTGLIIDGTTE